MQFVFVIYCTSADNHKFRTICFSSFNQSSL